MKFPERFRYGFCPETGKKADLMFAQHMLAVLRSGGMMATVMPHGVLFRGGAEKEIRKGFIEDDLLEAVIGLPPNLFYGTGIPACILVMRAKGAKPRDRRGQVLFINADAEYHAGRAQNYLRPEHIEKIASTFEAFRDVPGYAAVVSKADLAANDWNLNIRRYADNTPPPEPHDVRAHLLGGVPKAEVEAKRDLFAAHGFDPSAVFIARDLTPQPPSRQGKGETDSPPRNGEGQGKGYYDFIPSLTKRGQIKTAIESNPGVKAQEARLREAFTAWWQAHEQALLNLPQTRNPMAVRAELLTTFAEALRPVGLLDRFKVSGVIASWWNENQYDLKTLAAQGFDGLVDGWVATIRAALEDTEERANGARFDPLNHKLVVRLLPEYLAELKAAEARKAGLEIQLASIQESSAEASELTDLNEVYEEALSEAEVKALKKELANAKKALNALKAELVRRLGQARAALTTRQCQRLVLDIVRDDLAAELERYVAAHRQQVIAAVENWWDKYRVTLQDIEAERDAAVKRLTEFVRGLGYARQ
jgi:type I restriction enzyme M protein